MSKKQEMIPTIKSSYLFDAATVTRNELIEMINKFHRGDTGLCDYIVGLMLDIAKLRGFAPIRLVELEPKRTIAWMIKLHNEKADVWADSPFIVDGTDEVINYMDVRGQKKWVGLHYVGVRPKPEEVAKKIRELGARSFGQ